MLLKIDRKGSKSLYQQLIDEIKNLIDQETLRVGQSLPSTRSLADKPGINRSTVTRAYEELQALGYLCSRQGSYHKVESRRKVARYHPESHSIIPWDRILSAGAEDIHEIYLGKTSCPLGPRQTQRLHGKIRSRAVKPGSYYFYQNKPSFYFRLSITKRNEEEIEEGIKRLALALRNMEKERG
jgi:DNA-binding transcriptional MocR family regulator